MVIGLQHLWTVPGMRRRSTLCTPQTFRPHTPRNKKSPHRPSTVPRIQESPHTRAVSSKLARTSRDICWICSPDMIYFRKNVGISCSPVQLFQECNYCRRGLTNASIELKHGLAPGPATAELQCKTSHQVGIAREVGSRAVHHYHAWPVSDNTLLWLMQLLSCGLASSVSSPPIIVESSHPSR